MLLEQTHEKMIAMKLYGMAGSLKERLERADHQSLSKECTSGSRAWIAIVSAVRCRVGGVSIHKNN